MKDTIILKRATLKDTDNIFRVNNSDFVRNQSINKYKIDYTQHILWFQKMINSPDVVYFIAVDIDDNFIGSIHFDKDKHEDFFTVSVAIDKRFAGRGFGTYIINKASKMFKDISNSKILSIVKEENFISGSAFLKSGYSFVDTVEILGQRYRRYEL